MSDVLAMPMPVPRYFAKGIALHSDTLIGETPDVQTIVHSVNAGNVNAFNQLVSSYQHLAYNLAFRLLQNEESAADALQDSLLKAFRALPNFKGDRFRSWLLTIVANTCYDQLRVQSRVARTRVDGLLNESEEESYLIDHAEQPDAYAERMELRHCIERGLNLLAADQRAAVVLCDIQGFSYEEMAHIMNVPVGTVKSRLNRGRVRLRNFLLRYKGLLT